MKRNIWTIVAGILVFIIFSLACERPRVYPLTPEIKFKSLAIVDSVDYDDPGNSRKAITLTFSVIDGDGDIGIFGYKYDTTNIYPGFEDLGNKDLFVTLYEKKNGEFVEVSLKFPNNFSIPYTEPEGQDKSLIADIKVQMDIYFSYFTYDTIKYSFYMYDRQRHMSNIAETPEVPHDFTGVLK